MGNKVVHFGTAHRPFDIRVFHRECKTLAKAGYDVTFVAPHGMDEVVDGVRLTAIPSPRNRAERIVRTMRHVYLRARRARGDVYHFHDPELIPMAMILKLEGKRVIYDAHEDTPQAVLSKQYLPKWTRHVLSRLTHAVEMMGVRAFDGVIAATPAIARRFPKHKTTLVQNFPVIEDREDAAQVPYRDRPENIVHSGIASYSRGIKEILGALAMLPDDLPAKLVFPGRFEPAGLQPEIEELPGWHRVEYLGWLPRADISEIYMRARAGIVLFHQAPNHDEAQPGKLFEYMEAGLPVIASDFPHWRQFITDERCGILVDPTDARAVADAILRILRNPDEAEEMGRRGQEAIRKRYNWEQEAQGMLRLYARVMAP